MLESDTVWRLKGIQGALLAFEEEWILEFRVSEVKVPLHRSDSRNSRAKMTHQVVLIQYYDREKRGISYL